MSQLGIPQRQAVNRVSRGLAAEGLIARGYDMTSGKIVNRLTRGLEGAGSPVSAVATVRLTAAATTAMPCLDGDAAVREFAYVGELHLSEVDVKRAAGAALARDGWNVDTRWGHA